MISGLSLEDITKSYLFNCKKEIKSKKLIVTKGLLQHYKLFLGRKQRNLKLQQDNSEVESFSNYILQSDDRKASDAFKLRHFVKQPKTSSIKPTSHSCNPKNLRMGLSVEHKSSKPSLNQTQNQSEIRHKIQPKSNSNKSFSSLNSIKSDRYLADLQMKPERIKVVNKARPVRRVFPSDINVSKHPQKTEYVPMFDEFMARTIGSWTSSAKMMELKVIKRYPETESAFNKKRLMPSESIRDHKSVATITQKINSFTVSDPHSNRRITDKANQPECEKENLDISFQSTESFKCLKQTIDNFYSKACHPRSNYTAL